MSEIYVTVEDENSTPSTHDDEAYTLVDFHSGGKGIAFGQRANAGRFDCNMPVYLNSYFTLTNSNDWTANYDSTRYQGQIISYDKNGNRTYVIEQSMSGTTRKTYMRQYGSDSTSFVQIALVDNDGEYTIEGSAPFKAPAIYQDNKVVIDSSNYATEIPMVNSERPGLMNSTIKATLDLLVERVNDMLAGNTTVATVQK